MKRNNDSKIVTFGLVIFLFAVVLTANQVIAAEKVQLEGTIQGAKCTHFKVKCYNDDNHIGKLLTLEKYHCRSSWKMKPVPF